MKRIYNFSAGPSVLPESVLSRAGREIKSFKKSGQSVMEMSHRSKIFIDILEETKNLLREIMNIPINYEILFLQGGASSQFSMVPLNLFRKYRKAGFIITGQWSKKAYKEASRYGEAKIITSSQDKNFSYIPNVTKEMIPSDLDFIHICFNNTIYGTKFNYIPETGNVPLVADISSYILSEPIDVSKFGILYACAQKNMGPAGVTAVIIRKDLIGHEMYITPIMFNYKIHVENNSLFNTPPCYSIYICNLVLKWLKKEIGGLEEMKKINIKKANVLYDYLDNSKLFKVTVDKKYRSIMNIPFITGNKELDEEFIKQTEFNNMINLKGHRTVGGMRASIYNAMPIEGLTTLVDFMEYFESHNKK